MAIYANQANKPQASGVAYAKAITLLERHTVKSRGGIISFAECRRVLSWLYHFDREEVFVFLDELQAQGLCRVVPYKGVKIDSMRGNDQQK